MYKCLFEPDTDIFDNYFCTDRDIHGREPAILLLCMFRMAD